MKHFEIISKVYDREAMEFIQRSLRIELTDEEADLFRRMKESIEARKGFNPFEEKGWCDNDEPAFLYGPLSDVIEDSNGRPFHRFAIVLGCHTTDDQDENAGCGWINF